MIVVLASRHDPVALDLVAHWPGAALCSAEDLVRPGWAVPVARGGARTATWIIEGARVPDAAVRGVLVRRATVHAEELTSTHPNDRSYLATELHAFVVHVLAQTNALVVNPLDEGGAFGEAALRPERWLAAARDAGVPAAPLRVRSDGRAQPPAPTHTLEVVGERTIGAISRARTEAALAICARLSLRFAAVSFDDRDRLSAISARAAPTPAALDALGQLLASGGPR